MTACRLAGMKVTARRCDGIAEVLGKGPRLQRRDAVIREVLYGCTPLQRRDAVTNRRRSTKGPHRAAKQETRNSQLSRHEPTDKVRNTTQPMGSSHDSVG
jgi:hypothetical protein